jgi:hypothetical protein
MSADTNTNQKPDQANLPGRPEKYRFAPPPQTEIPEENFEPYDSYGKKPKKHTGRKVFIILLIIVVLAAAGAAAYLLFIKPKPVAKAPATPSNTAAANSTAAVTTKHYDSTNFSLGIDYPSTWIVADADGVKLTVKSPLENLPAASGTTQSGEIVMTIQNKQTSLPDFAKGSATAVLNSDNVAYTKPTTNQRANTNLSYLQYAATTTAGALDGIYITGNNGYQKGQDVPQVDITGVDPLVTVTFVSCTDSSCAAPKPLSLEAASWQKNALAAPVKAMLQSLSFN